MFKNFKTLPSSTFSLLKNLVFFMVYAHPCPPSSNPVIMLWSLTTNTRSSSNFLNILQIFNFLGSFNTFSKDPKNSSNRSSEEQTSGYFFFFLQLIHNFFFLSN